jgi:hypothetical protein
MAWDYTDINIAPATGAVAIWTAIARLKVNGASQKDSGDGLAGYGTSAVTSGAAGAGGLGNTTAWVRLHWTGASYPGPGGPPPRTSSSCPS